MANFPRQPDDLFKAYAYEQVATIGKALCAPARLILLNILCQGERSVEILANEAGLSVANASQHLQALRHANLVESQRNGNHVIYHVAGKEVVVLFSALKNLALDRMTTLKQAFDEISRAPSRLHPVSREELIEKVKGGEVVVIDVRPEEEYRAGHIPNAISIPLEHLEEHLERLPKDKEIVALCRGEYCVLADKAIDILRARGLTARRATDGPVEWELAGLPLETGNTD